MIEKGRGWAGGVVSHIEGAGSAQAALLVLGIRDWSEEDGGERRGEGRCGRSGVVGRQQ